MADGPGLQPTTGPITGAPERTLESLRALEKWSRNRDWDGSPWYDGLSTRRVFVPLRRQRRKRQLFMQSVQRSPLDLRERLGIRLAAPVAQRLRQDPQLAGELRGRLAATPETVCGRKSSDPGPD